MLVVLGDDPFSSGAITTLERLRAGCAASRGGGPDVTRIEWPARRRSRPRRCEQAKSDIVRLALAALAVNLCS